MRIDNPISINAIITGSFTGSFKGDGSNLAGVTAEWDGSHTGDASITGDLTVGNLITAGVVDGVDVSDLKSSFDIDSAKLAGIEAGATGDQSGAEIKTAYEAEADTNAYTDAEKSKLAALEAGATGDQTGAEIKALYEGEADTNAFTDAASAKLAGIEASATGDQTAAEILTAIKTVDGAGSGLDADLLDGQSSAYYATATSVATNTTKLAGIEAGATGDQSAAEIKTAYESNADTNAFDDAAVSKLAGIEAGATNDTAELSTLTGRVTDVEGDVSAILLGSQADKDSFAEIVTLINSVDTTNDTAFGAHVANTSNPHSVTKAQVGLGNVDNTSDASKPISTATQTALDSKQAAGTYNTIIGTDTDVNTSGATIIDNIYMTDGVITSHGTRVLTLADLGYSGATNANYITNNNQLTNGAGYLTSYTDTNTTYSAGSGITLTGTTFSLTTPITNNNQLTNGAGYTTYTSNQATNTTSAVNFASVTATGNITAYSDARLKKDVKTIEGALAKTNSLRGVEYTRIADDAKSIGVIAQELEAVLPELVATDDEGMKSVNYAQITGLLIEAVKELSAKVDELSK